MITTFKKPKIITWRFQAMGNNITEMVFILDRSGSMTGLESNAPIRAMRQNRQVSDDWGKGIEEDFQNRK